MKRIIRPSHNKEMDHDGGGENISAAASEEPTAESEPQTDDTDAGHDERPESRAGLKRAGAADSSRVSQCSKNLKGAKENTEVIMDTIEVSSDDEEEDEKAEESTELKPEKSAAARFDPRKPIAPTSFYEEKPKIGAICPPILSDERQLNKIANSMDVNITAEDMQKQPICYNIKTRNDELKRNPIVCPKSFLIKILSCVYILN